MFADVNSRFHFAYAAEIVYNYSFIIKKYLKFYFFYTHTHTHKLN